MAEPIVPKRKRKPNGAIASIALGVGALFSALFDPAKATSTEEIERQSRLGDYEAEHNRAG